MFALRRAAPCPWCRDFLLGFGNCMVVINLRGFWIGFGYTGREATWTFFSVVVVQEPRVAAAALVCELCDEGVGGLLPRWTSRFVLLEFVGLFLFLLSFFLDPCIHASLAAMYIIL